MFYIPETLELRQQKGLRMTQPDLNPDFFVTDRPLFPVLLLPSDGLLHLNGALSAETCEGSGGRPGMQDGTDILVKGKLQSRFFQTW
jgi:hypothetical protein